MRRLNEIATKAKACVAQAPACVGFGSVHSVLAGCARLDMQDQPKYRPQRPSDFFADGRSERQPVKALSRAAQLKEDTASTTGKDAAGKDVEVFRSRSTRP